MSTILKTLTLVLSLTLAACVQTPIQPSQSSQTTQATLQDTNWILTRLESQPVTTSKPAQLRLNAEGRLSGTGGCNRITGAYQLTGAQIAFSQTASTRMACIGDVTAAEDAFFKALAQVASWEIKAQTLSLRDADGKVVLELEAAEAQQ
jgi:heat shock protein HslJ